MQIAPRHKEALNNAVVVVFTGGTLHIMRGVHGGVAPIVSGEERRY